MCSGGRAQVKSSEYNNLKSQLGQVTRKSQGSLAVRDVSTVVKPSMVIDTEHLITLFVVVSKFAVKEWDETYEKMCSFVVGGPAGPAGAVSACLCGWENGQNGVGRGQVLVAMWMAAG